MAGETTANAPGKAETDPEDATAKAGDGAKAADAADGEKQEEEEECGFCKFMKGGSCKTAFVAWEDCVDKAKESDGVFVEKCAKQTEALRDCMLADPGYYGDMLPDEGEADDEKKDSEAARSDAKARPSEPATAAPAKQSRAAAAVTGASR